MANLFLMEIPSNAKKSTETIYEIKAPLATFDTIDLDDFEDDNVSRKSVVSNDKTPTGECEKPITQETELVKGVDTPEATVTVERVISVSVSNNQEKKPIGSDNNNVDSPNDSSKLKQLVEENHNVNVSPKETKKKIQKTTNVNNKTKEVKATDKNTNSEVVNGQSKHTHKEHAVSSVRTKIGKILSPKSHSKGKVSELRLNSDAVNGDTKVNGSSPVKNNRTSVASLEDPATPTPTEEVTQPDKTSVDSLNSESENNASGGGSHGDLMDPNSSENNASAEDIQTKLKQKGRRHKEKASNVKYEKIGSLSDVSDQEKSENPTSLPGLKLKTKAYDSDSDSTDSDSGYIRRGYIANAKGIAPQHLRSIVGGTDSVDSDSTPCSSPKISRPVIPPPLSKEDAAKISKRKAYEKRLQRLQVTNTPIERPRSTTPINIHGLEEYAGISSPERSPAKGSLEKLKIKLPLDDLGRSPRHLTGHRRCASGDGQVFNFNEELLFTHTKSAILLEENGTQNLSPKRILVPPTLSPKLSPAHLVKSPRNTSGLDPSHPPKYFFNPKSPTAYRKVDDTAAIDPRMEDVNNDKCEDTNWAKFDDMKTEENTVEAENHDSICDAQGKDNVNKSDCCKTSVNAEEDIFSAFDEKFDEELNKEEILTVKIVETGDNVKCDIECHTKEKDLQDINIGCTKELNNIKQSDNGEKLKIEDGVKDKAIILDEDINSLC